MKEKIVILLGLCISLLACNNVPGPLPPDIRDNGSLLVIQFEKVEYKDYIMIISPDTAEYPYPPEWNVYDTYLTSNNKYNPTALIPTELADIYHKSPYIDLADNYVLVDWKAIQMIGNILFANTYQPHYLDYGKHWEYTPEEALIKNKWEDFDDINKQWPLKSFFVDYPIKRFFFITIDALNSYNKGLTHPSFIPYEIETYVPYSSTKKTTTDRWNELVENKGENFAKELISEADAAYDEYKEILIKMMNEDILLSYVNPESIYTHLTNK